MPAFTYVPQLATLVKEPPTGDQWLHEIKYDGYRIGAFSHVVARGCTVATVRTGRRRWRKWRRLHTRFRSPMPCSTAKWPWCCRTGTTSFQALQNAFSSENAAARASLVYFVFDLLRLDGTRTDTLPLEERKARLRRLLGRPNVRDRIRFSDHVEGGGEAFFTHACRLGLEGIISKRRDQPYRPGRNDGWLKTKCVLRQEFAIGGFTEPEGASVGIGALLIGYYDDRQRLIFSGKVGTGFTHASSVELRRRLQRLEQRECPFAERPAGSLGKNAHWVTPRLVCEVEFTEWTSDGKIRHPSFQGIREDKRPLEARKERPDPAVIEGVRITHPDRVVYPAPGLTKLDVARYYDGIGRWIAPHVRGRPLTLVRCPDGVKGDCFFMKHSKVWAPSPLRRVHIQEKTKVGEYLIADDVAGVVGLVQMGVLEIHTWNSDIARVEEPNRLVFDLDPGDKVTWRRVVEAARTVHESLRALGLESFVKTTGGAGLHVVVPLVPQTPWSACLAFSRAIAETVARSNPTRYTTTFAKAGRANKILIDYLRNNRTNTSVAAYSTRANARATVSMPLGWKELSPSLDASAFTVVTVPKRLAKLRADPWADYWSTKQRLTRPMLKAMGM